MRICNSRYLEIDEENIEKKVYEAFTERFGAGFVKKIYIGKYPSNYEVVVYIKSKRDLTEILKLSHLLSDDFEEQGLPVGISVREYES
ncbi:hypothetical protein GF312_12610 [Candidatus Poribacteria bacterium]|nr:hypothetical protein [Candidatus Poribacteria bacterium]